MALTRYKKTVVASASNSAAGTTRGRLDLTAEAGDIYGGIITAKITNGGTGPTVPCRINVLISHETTLPAAGSAGADWKTLASFTATTSNNAILEQYWTFGPEVRHIEIEFTGNTGQAVTVEAIATLYGD